MWHDATSYVVQYSSLTMAGCRSIQSSSSSQLSEKVKMTVEKRLQIRMLGSYKATIADVGLLEASFSFFWSKLVM